MMRRMSIATLTVAMGALALPTAAVADDRAEPIPVQAKPVSGAPRPFHPSSVQKATRGIALTKSAQRETGAFLSKPRGKATLAAAIIVAGVIVGYAASQGPDPTPATTK